MASEQGVYVNGKKYNIPKSILICETPQGTLYKKNGRGRDFFLYNKDGKVNREKFIDVTWAEANNLTRTYGTREMQEKYFTLYEKSDTTHKGSTATIRLDEYHAVKAFRNAQIKGMPMSTYIKMLIDKDDEMNNYCL